MRIAVKLRERIQDKDLLDSINKYEIYKRELGVLIKSMEYARKSNLNPHVIALIYKQAELEVKSDNEAVKRLKKFNSCVREEKERNPKVDLKNISTHQSRTAVSNIISETQNDPEFRPAYLTDVAIFENIAVAQAVASVNDRYETKEMALAHYDVNEQKFDEAQEQFQKYKRLGLTKKFEESYTKKHGKRPNSIITACAAMNEDTLFNTYEILKRLGVEKGDYIIPHKQKYMEVYEISKFAWELAEKIADPIERNRRKTDLQEVYYSQYQFKKEVAEEYNRIHGAQIYNVPKIKGKQEIEDDMER